MTPRPMTRRQVLRRAGAGAGLLAGWGLLAGCSDDSSSSAPSTPSVASGPVRSQWTMDNWPSYIDVDANGRHRSIDLFDQQYRTDTTYLEGIHDNVEFYEEVRGDLAAGKSIGRDLVVLSDWMAGRWVQAGYAEQIDVAGMPNVEAFLQEPWRNRPVDPAGRFLVPYQSGLVVLAYDATRFLEPPTGLKPLIEDATVQLAMVEDMRDALGATMLSMGINPAAATVSDASAAAARLRPLVERDRLTFTSDQSGLFGSRQIAAGMVWSTDLAAIQTANADVQYVIPEEGCMFWTDDMLIPRGAAAARNATLWMNFVYRPVIAAMIAADVRYTCPVLGARNALTTGGSGAIRIDQDPELAADPLVFPVHAVLRQMRSFNALTPGEEAKMTDIFAGLVRGG
jgi:spermidine/putrescine transport system substrate-binding protein